MKLNEAVEFMFDEAKKYNPAQFDIIGSSSESSGIEVFESKVSQTDLNNSRGIGIRFFFDKKPGISFTEKFSKEAIKQTLKDAFENSKVTDEMDLDLPELEKLNEFDLGSYKEEINSVSNDEMISICLELEKKSFQESKKVENVPYLGMGKSFSESIILNSKGVKYYEKSNSISAGVGVVTKENSKTKMGYYGKSGRSLKIFDTDLIAKTAVERGIELLDAEKIDSGKYNILFSNRISGGIISMFLSPYFAENVQKDQSRLKDKLNEKIAVEFMNLYLDPHLIDFPGSGFLDSEGVPTRKISLIENGVLKAFLYNLESAKKAKVAPNGAGVRSYAGKASTGISNLFIEKGNISLKEQLNSFKEILYITKLEGSSGCSALSGEISIGVQGILYKNGERLRAVDNITLSTNYFDLLKKIHSFSNEYNDSFSSVKVPDILVTDLNIAG